MNQELIKAFFELKERGFLWAANLPEYRSISYNDKLSDKYPKGYIGNRNPTFYFDKNPEINKQYCETFGVMTEDKRTVYVSFNGEEFPIEAFVMKDRYNRFFIQTNPALNRSIKRKSKKYPEGIKLTRDMLNSSKSYQEFKKDFEEKKEALIRFQTARFLVELRNSGLINKKKLKSILLEDTYDRIKTKEEKKQFLINQGFSGVEENFGVYEERPDGYGHTTGKATMIDFDEKKVYVAGFSSDD